MVRRSRHLHVVACILLWVLTGSFPGTARAQNAAPNSNPNAYTGTAMVTYTRLPWLLLPNAAVPYAGPHEATVHFAVQDQSHFRVDIQIVQPAIEAGTVTVVVNGWNVASYDSRTETAGTSKLTLTGVPPQYRAFLRQYYRRYLLAQLMGGNVFGGIPAEPKPSETLKKYLDLLRGRNNPLCLPLRSVHRTAQQQLLGESVDVVDVKPILASESIKGCSFDHPGHCVRRITGQGTGRLWVDHNHPVVLQYQEQGFTDPHGDWRVDYRYTVTAITFGQGPTAADLHYVPPVKAPNTGSWSILSGGQGTTGGPNGQVPSGFVNAPDPSNILKKPWVLEGISYSQAGPRKRTTAVDVLYSTGKHVITYRQTPNGKQPWGMYVKGPYIYAQERTQVHGLSTGLQVGTPQKAGACQVWSGAYTNGPLWAAFALGKTAVVISTNALSQSQLLRYIGSDVCPGKLHAGLKRPSLMSGARPMSRYHLTTPLRVLQDGISGSPWQSDTADMAGSCSGGGYSAQIQSGVGPIAPPLRPGGKSRQHTNAYFAILSTGTDMPNLVMTIDSKGSWTPMRVTATRDMGTGQTSVKVRLLAHTGTTYTWYYGSLPNGAVARIYLQLHLANPCCYQIFLQSYANLKNGRPDPYTLIPGASLAMGGGSSSSPPPPTP